MATITDHMYDEDTDSMYVRLSPLLPIVNSTEITFGTSMTLVADYLLDDTIVGLEVLEASTFLASLTLHEIHNASNYLETWFIDAENRHPCGIRRHATDDPRIQLLIHRESKKLLGIRIMKSPRP